METTYTMIGMDGAQYGPISLEQFKSWIAEGRVTGDTKVMRSDTKSWLPAANYAELGLTLEAATQIPTSTPGVARPSVIGMDPLQERRIRQGARWFFWIAGLSLVNTLMGLRFYIGILGVTDIINEMASERGATEMLVKSVNVAAAGIYILCGIFAFKRQSWAFIVGMIFYALDAVVFLLASSWIVLGFHVFVLFWIFLGLKANLQANSQA
jgi:hypothetical protein